MSITKITPLLIAALAAILALAAPAHAWELGAADDGRLNYGTDTATVLDSMAAHGVKSLRLTAWSDRPYDNQLAATREAIARGLQVQVVLGPYYSDLPPSTDWFTTAAAAFYAAGARTFSILNEPDLWLPVSGRCDTDREVRYRVSSAGMSTVHVRSRVWRHVTRKRARGHKRYVRVRYTTPGGRKVWKHRRNRHGRWIRVWRVVERVVPMTVESDAVRYEPQMGCIAVARARLTRETYLRVVPAVRQVAPGATVLGGETSPSMGVAAFTTEMVRLGIPPGIDGWAHHPYPSGGEWKLEDAAQVNAMVPLPVYWTEFGVPIREHDPGMTAEHARAIWADAGAKAERLGIRQIVAYGWFASTMRWDTAAEGVLF